MRNRGPVLRAIEDRSGFPPAGLVASMRQRIAATGLDLSGLTVLTEAATGAYSVTPVIAALAGAAQVHAVARPSRHGSVATAHAAVEALAHAAGVAERIQLADHVPDGLLAHVDVVTNSGHLRPLGAELIAQLPARAVIALMFEAWEFRPSDIDLAACRHCGVRVAGVNERHPAIDVFSFLGPLCAQMLGEAGARPAAGPVAVLCDNAFGPYLEDGLGRAGFEIGRFTKAADLPCRAWNAVVVALRPAAEPRIDAAAARRLAMAAPAARIVQFWGDIDRTALAAAGLTAHPRRAPRPGHMGILLDALGPEPIVRLQTGGLRAAEWVWRGGAVTPDGFAELL
ncbi:hypothetical protein [Chelatococcus sp. GCM10030263]|uniref:hypothetical protein n=1 Tax=Chelatococcus sp. GCM10030263 TaxID=3273387 RepID=UPI00366D4117